VKFSTDATESAFAARDVSAEKEARTLTEELIAMSQEEFSAAFRKSPMKRAKLAGLQRNARVVLDDEGARGGAREGIVVLTHALDAVPCAQSRLDQRV
jgi:epoxyqueuosine reductase